MNNYRIKIAPLLVSFPEKIVGMSADEVIDCFGAPDYTHSDLLRPEELTYAYSTSSLEMIDGKCGEPVIRSFGIILHKEKLTVIRVQEFIH